MAYEVKVASDKLFPDVAVGVKLPIVTTGGQLFNQSYSTQDQAISNLKNLILTRQGERLYQPLFGTKLQDALFEQNTAVIKEVIRTSITDAVGFWLPYITINSLKVETVVAVGTSNEEHGITVSMVVSVNGQSSGIPITFLITSNSIQELYATT
jgi:phage baseplate assembly protein W